MWNHIVCILFLSGFFQHRYFQICRGEQYSTLQISYNLFYSPVVDHFSSFQFLVILNKAAVNVCVQVFVWTCISFSLGQMCRTGVAKLCESCMFNLNHPTAIFQSGYTIFHSSNAVYEFQCLHILTYSGYGQFFLTFVILKGMQWYLMVSIRIFLASILSIFSCAYFSFADTDFNLVKFLLKITSQNHLFSYMF